MGVNFSIEIGISFNAGQPDRRLGIRQFSMADRNIGAQMMRLCA